ncbi:LysE family translocator [Halomonas sp. KM-1]|uniref:LysE family translocator n=1 Tax=Halomonas sp. KM-1 TaxID=590061 RepID=UPI000289406B|nr:LysE family transporter [Halomonas sp. KM-1]
MTETLGFMAAVIGLLITPGPTNTLLAASGSQRGMRASVSLIPAELAGYLLAIALWGSVLGSLGERWEWLTVTLRIASALYIAYLALRMWRSATDMEVAAKAVVSHSGLFLATLLNPKALLFAAAIFPQSAFRGPVEFVLPALLFSLLLIPIAAFWIAFGTAVASGRLTWLSPFVIQRGAAVVLAGFSLSLGWSTLH